MTDALRVLLGTRKGLIVLERSGEQQWRVKDTHFLGAPVTIADIDPRNGTWWALLDHGHWGCKMHRSRTGGASWEEVPAPSYGDEHYIKDGKPASTRLLWAFAHGGHDRPDRLWVGTEPGGLFRSDDGGDSWKLVESLWNMPRREEWFGGGRDEAAIHSIIVDPNDSDHIYVGVSCAGVFETRDGGETWRTRNKGLKADFLPDPNSEVGQDPHMLVACPSALDRLWQQNHCGVFRSDNGGELWHDVSNDVAYFGFAVAVHPQNPDRAWLVPGVSDECRVAVDGALYVARTDDGGATWQDLREGLPQDNVYDIAYRHSLDVDDTGENLLFGTTTGNVFASRNGGDSWFSVGSTLPPVYSVRFI